MKATAVESIQQPVRQRHRRHHARCILHDLPDVRAGQAVSGAIGDESPRGNPHDASQVRAGPEIAGAIDCDRIDGFVAQPVGFVIGSKTGAVEPCQTVDGTDPHHAVGGAYQRPDPGATPTDRGGVPRRRTSPDRARAPAAQAVRMVARWRRCWHSSPERSPPDPASGESRGPACRSTESLAPTRESRAPAANVRRFAVRRAPPGHPAFAGRSRGRPLSTNCPRDPRTARGRCRSPRVNDPSGSGLTRTRPSTSSTRKRPPEPPAQTCPARSRRSVTTGRRAGSSSDAYATNSVVSKGSAPEFPRLWLRERGRASATKRASPPRAATR